MDRPQEGDIVASRSGHDADRLYVVIATEPERVLLCDGKRRRLHCPKRKNLRHVEKRGGTNLAERLQSGAATDKEIRTTIAIFKAQEGTRLGKR